MDRVTAIALSTDEMLAFSKRFFSNTIESKRVQQIVITTANQAMSKMLEDLKASLPTYSISLQQTLTNGLCIAIDGRRFALESIALHRPSVSKL